MPKLSELTAVTVLSDNGYVVGVQDGEDVLIPASEVKTSETTNTFINLTDAPETYEGQAGRHIVVNEAEDGLEFIDPPSDIPDGGTKKQVLSKNSSTDQDMSWADVIEVSSSAPSSPVDNQLWLDSSENPIPNIITGTATPSSPVDKQLWIDENYSFSDNPGVVDLTGASSDYSLRRGEIAIITYTSLSTIPLHIATAEGLYMMDVVGAYYIPGTNNNSYYLRPNNTSYDSAIQTLQLWNTTNANNHGSNSWTEGNFTLGDGIAFFIRSEISTFTNSKYMISHILSPWNSDHQQRFQSSVWKDTTTVWSSLGTINFPFNQTGRIIVRRIY